MRQSPIQSMLVVPKISIYYPSLHWKIYELNTCFVGLSIQKTKLLNVMKVYSRQNCMTSYLQFQLDKPAQCLLTDKVEDMNLQRLK